MDLKILYTLLLLVFAASHDLKNQKKKKELPSCEVCKQLVKSFKKGIEKTSRGNFAGGDTAWEEEKLGKYHKSEVRLVEIQEKLCFDELEGEAQCHALAEAAEYELETWWFKKQETYPDLEQWLCISTKKVCCLPGHYGSHCEKCPGFPDAICSGHGKCEGSGTRNGTGQCICEAGYDGKLCEECAVNYFNVPDKGTQISCSPCHVSCESDCMDGSPKGCKACKKGWKMNAVAGCVDIDECRTSENVCKNNEVCINNEGSYTCQDITRYVTKDPGRWVRYTTYVTFIIATGVFLRKNVLLGSFVGLIAAIYVSASELVMNDMINLSRIDVKSWF